MSGARASVLRLCAAAFLADLSLYLIMTGAPYQALALGAGPLLLGLLPVARALPYTASTLGVARLTEGGERLRWARGSLLVAAAVTAGLALGGSLPVLFAVMGVLGLALAFFWPALQATLADLGSSSRRAGAHLGWFNIGWSLGKATGFALGGMLLAGPGFPAVYGLAALAFVAVVVLLSATRIAPLGGDAPGIAEPPPPRAAAFRRAAWLANAVAFGAGATLNTHYPNWLARHGEGETVFGTFLGLVFLFQTGTFAVLTRFRGWTYRPAFLLWPQLPIAAVLVALPFVPDVRLLLITAPLAGVGMGVTYFASLFYSVEAWQARGRRAAMHEAVLGVGAVALPVAGGLAAALTGRLEAPYLVAGAVALASLGAQVLLLYPLPVRKGRRMRGRRREYSEGIADSIPAGRGAEPWRYT